MTAAKKLRLAFMGTPDFAVPALEALLAAGHQVVAVYSQPPRPKGRGHQVQKSPVHQAAERANIPVYTPLNLKTAEDQQQFADLNLDAAVVAAYGLILPKAVLAAPRMGCINIHASLLPRWRGAAPIVRALLAGDVETGNTIMQMDVGLDTGAMWLKKSIPITSESTAQSLHDELSELGGRMIVEALDGIASGMLQAVPQPEAGVLYAEKLRKEESLIDWNHDAVDLERKVRALNPWPGVAFESHNERIKILSAKAVDGKALPGTLLDDQLTIACGTGALRILRAQRPGRSATDGEAFLRGFSVRVGDSF